MNAGTACAGVRRVFGWRVMTAALVLTAALASAQDGGTITAPRVLIDASPRYPPEHLDQPIAGEAALSLVLALDGGLERAEVITATDDSFAREALHAAAALRFSPALLDDQPVSVAIEYRFTFLPPAPPADAGTPATLVGEVRARGTRVAVPLAWLTTDAGAEATADVDGHFRLELPAGTHVVHVAAPGYLPTDFTETLSAGDALTVRYVLQPRQLRAFQTVVRGDRERSELGRVSLHDAELTDVAGTGGDPLKVVMVLPGVSSIASGAAYPVVRGSSPSATGYFIDGIRVPQLFHVFLGPAVVHPSFIEGVDFYAGGAPVKYGRLLGGVIDATIREPSKELHANASIDLLNLGAFVDLPIERTGTSVTVAGRYGYSGLLLGPISQAFNPKQRLVADFWDYQARVQQKLGGGTLRLFAFGSSDDFGSTRLATATRPPSTGTQSVRFHRVDLRYRHPLGVGPFQLAATFGQDVYGFDSEGPVRGLGNTNPDARSSQITNITQWSGSARTSWNTALSNAFNLGVGGSFDNVRSGASVALTVNIPPQAPFTNTSERALAVGSLTAGWAQLQFTGVEHFSATAGVRLDNFHLVPGINQTSADPRVSLQYDPTEWWSLRAAAGLYHQAPTFLITLPVVDVASLKYGLQEVLQTSAGATWKMWRELELSADVYFNPMARVAEYGIFDDEVARDIDPTRPQSGGLSPDGPPVVSQGRAYGLDLMVRWPMRDRFFGWVTASVQRSERYQSYKSVDPEGNFGNPVKGWLPYAFDQTFVANAVLGYRFDNGFSVSGTLHFNTGRPESGQFGSRTEVASVDSSGQPTWVQVSRDRADRLPAYFRVDVRASKTWLFDAFTLEAYLDVLNVTVRQEVIGFDYSGGDGQPLTKIAQTVPVVFPSLGLVGRY